MKQLGWLAIVIFLSSAASSAFADSSAGQRYSADFSFAGGDRERAALNAAIEKSIDGLFFVVKPIARGKLRNKNAIHSHFAFEFPEGKIRCRTDGLEPIESPANGRPVSFRLPSGESVQVSQRYAADHIVQFWKSDEGTRSDDFSLNADGTILTLKIVVTSPKLSQALEYSLTYKKR